MNTEEIESVTGYLKTEWDCPDCNEPNSVEGDATGDCVTCTHCLLKVRIDKVM